MKVVRIISIVTFFVALALGYYLYASIDAPVKEAKRIAAIEEKVIEKLKVYRELQVAYYSVHNQYAGSVEALQKFVNTDRFYILQTTERTLGANDSVEIKIDTLGTIAVKDSIFTNINKIVQIDNPDEYIKNLASIPGSPNNAKFEVFAGKFTKNQGAVEVHVFEVKDTDPVNPDRIFGRKGKAPLQVGSRDESTTSGNWE